MTAEGQLLAAMVVALPTAFFTALFYHVFEARRLRVSWEMERAARLEDYRRQRLEERLKPIEQSIVRMADIGYRLARAAQILRRVADSQGAHGSRTSEIFDELKGEVFPRLEEDMRVLEEGLAEQTRLLFIIFDSPLSKALIASAQILNELGELLGNSIDIVKQLDETDQQIPPRQASKLNEYLDGIEEAFGNLTEPAGAVSLHIERILEGAATLFPPRDLQ